MAKKIKKIQDFTVLDSAQEDRFVYDVNVDYSSTSEPDLYSTYKKLFYENNYARYVALDLLYHVFSKIQIVSHGENADRDEKRIKDFIYENDIINNLEQVVLQAIIYGNGFFYADGKIFKRIDAELITLERDNSGNITYYLEYEDDEDFTNVKGADKLGRRTINGKYMHHLKFIEVPDTPYGISHYRSNIHDLQAMMGISRDAYAAIKGNSVKNRILGLDLEGMSEEDIEEAYTNAKNKFKDFNASTTTILVMDKRNELYELGTKNGGQGKGIEPFAPIIETPLGVIMGNFAVSQGVLLPTGANKSILQETERHHRFKIEAMRRKLSIFTKNLIEKYLKLGADFEILFTDPITDPLKEKEFALLEVQQGILSIEEYRQMFYPELEKRIKSDHSLIVNNNPKKVNKTEVTQDNSDRTDKGEVKWKKTI